VTWLFGNASAFALRSGSATSAGAIAASSGADRPIQTVKVVVNEQGFEPAKVSLRARTPARITFVRTTDKTCGTESRLSVAEHQASSAAQRARD
jgi:hypothetical protein